MPEGMVRTGEERNPSHPPAEKLQEESHLT
jgi:hypothetical protein